jgi:hypothetical protein
LDRFARLLQHHFLLEMQFREVRRERSEILGLQRAEQAVPPVGRYSIRIHRGSPVRSRGPEDRMM